MMEHVLMDERGNTTKTTYSKSNRSILAYVLFGMMFVMGGVGAVLFYNHVHNGPTPAAMFTPLLSSPLAGFGGKCTVTPDAEDFAACSSGWEKVEDSQVLRCPSGYGNIEVQKVKDGETGHKNYRDMALLRHFCKGMDNCKLHLGELRAADDGMPIDDAPPMEIEELEPEPEVDPEAIIEDVAGVDSNGHVLMRHHGHHQPHHQGQVKIIYECEKLDGGPFDALETFFEDFMGPGDLEIQEVDVLEPEAEDPYAENAAEAPATPLFLSAKHKHGHCDGKLKNVAQYWDVASVCGTVTDEVTLGCDEARSGARIFVLSVAPKTKHQHQPTDSGVDPVIEDTTGTVEDQPFLSRRGHGKHPHGGGKHKAGKQLGLQLTDICAEQEGSSCSVVLGQALQNSFAENPLIDETTPIHVKYMCSYARN